MRATRSNLSPIFSLFDDPGDAAWNVINPITENEEPEFVPYIDINHPCIRRID